MTDNRRALVEGLKTPPAPLDPKKEEAFVYAAKNGAVAAMPEVAGSTTSPTTATAPARVPISTRMRADLAAALKRASLERQLNKIEPNALQDILEQAVEPWLRNNGYLK